MVIELDENTGRIHYNGSEVGYFVENPQSELPFKVILYGVACGRTTTKLGIYRMIIENRSSFEV